MKKMAVPIALLLVAACATTPIGREMQAVKALTAANDAAVSALDFGVIKADDGVAIQEITRAATADLKRAIAARRAGASIETWERIMAIVDDALERVTRVIMQREQG